MKWEALRRAVLCRRQPALAVAIATLTLIALGVGPTHASGTVRLTFDGQIELSGPPNQGSPTAEELGLEDGDPVQLLIEFDRALPPAGLGGVTSITPSRFEILLAGVSFPEESQLGFLPTVQATGMSGFTFLADYLESGVGELNGIEVVFALESGATQLVGFSTTDIGFDGAQFPTALDASDIVGLDSLAVYSFRQAPLDPQGAAGEFFRINFSGLTVNAIPEPSAAAIALVGVAGVLGRRAKRRTTAT